MEFFDSFHSALAAGGRLSPEWIYALLGLLGLCLGIQLVYYLGLYGGIARYRNNRGLNAHTPSPPVSVIVVVRESHFYFVEHLLCKLLSQQYDPYEVVVVDCSYSEEIGHLLVALRERNPHMHLTQIKSTNNLNHGTKLAITVGIKAARYEHLVLTTADAYPTSDKWLSLMAKGFINGDIVLGYCGVEHRRGLANRLIRCSRLGTSVRWLSAAIRRHPYRGIAHNLGYTKSLYFAHRGFNHLNMNIGDDDLFIRQIATRSNVSVVLNPQATVREIPYGKARWWSSTRKFFSQAYPYYPLGVRITTGLELWSRTLFFAAAIAAICLMPFPWNMIPVGVLLLRLLVVAAKTRGIARRLGERKLLWAYLFYDLYAPLAEAGLAVSRSLRPNRSIWR